MELIGIFLAIALLMYLAYKGYHIVPISILVAIIVIVSNGMNVWEGLNGAYMKGLTGFTYLYGLVLIFGAIFGQIMGDSGSAKSISYKIISIVGTKNVLLSTVLITSILSFAGISTFVIIFTVFPLAKVLFEQAKLPQKLIVGAVAFGAGTYTMSSLPYSPSVQNVIPTTILGTNVAAAPALGIFAGVLLFILGYIYLSREVKKEIAINISNGIDMDNLDRNLNLEDESLPHWIIALIPVILVIGTLIFTKDLMPAVASLNLALILGIISASALNTSRMTDFKKSLASGSTNGVNALMIAAAVIGFATVVKSVSGFESFVQYILGLKLHPYISLGIGVNIIAGIVGSATGGIQIFLETLGPHYVAMGLPPEAIHRLATISSGGLDSLPHCSSVVILLYYMGLSHKEAYKYIGVTTVLIPLIVAVVSIPIAMVLY